jgi:hypothetical protein
MVGLPFWRRWLLCVCSCVVEECVGRDRSKRHRESIRGQRISLEQTQADVLSIKNESLTHCLNNELTSLKIRKLSRSTAPSLSPNTSCSAAATHSTQKAVESREEGLIARGSAPSRRKDKAQHDAYRGFLPGGDRLRSGVTGPYQNVAATW